MFSILLTIYLTGLITVNWTAFLCGEWFWGSAVESILWFIVLPGLTIKRFLDR